MDTNELIIRNNDLNISLWHIICTISEDEKFKIMKRLNNNIGMVILTIGFFSMSLFINAQETKPTRQEKMEARKESLAANFNILDSLLNEKNFVLEADYLGNQYGNLIPVSPNVNFIKVNSTDGILQTGSYYSMGLNGVGGVTTEGKIQSWKVYRDFKKLSYNLRFSISTTLGFYDVSMFVTSDNHAVATITGLLPGRLIYQGHLETVGNSRVFKGTTVM